MPFPYFGAKHRLARYYPPPKYRTVIEPFAGAAGYACYWAKRGYIDHAILVDSHPGVVALWHRLQRMTPDDLANLVVPPLGTLSTEPLFMYGQQQQSVLDGKQRRITSWMLEKWEPVQRRLIEILPIIKDWDVSVGDYSDVPDIPGTWFIDPPYRPQLGLGGKPTSGGYWYKHRRIDYDALADWVWSRPGQVIACEQNPADWLPFEPFRQHQNGVGAGRRTMMVESIFLWDNPV